MSANRILVGLVAASICLGPARGAFGSGCPGSPNQSVGPDVVVASITGPMNFTAVANREALTFGSDACNLGDEEVLWSSCLSTDHPVFGGNLYRWSTVNGATRFEQVGQSWLKHGFAAAQDDNCCSNCQPSGVGWRLGLGCDDAYIASQMANQNSLGPKNLVNAHTGIYPQETCTTHPSGGNNGRLEVMIADLVATTGGEGAAVRYFAQFQYVTADDAAAHNQNNNASTREITVSGSDDVWNFSFSVGSATMPEIPSIRLWQAIDPGVIETDVETPEDDGFPGLVILAAKATDLGTGFWRYEYAVNNLNSDRSIGGFSVPCSMYATVQNIGFHDVFYRGGDGVGGVNYDGTNWPGAFAGGAVSWATTPFVIDDNANAIRWGTLYNFRFDANLPPAPANGDVTLTEFKVVVDVLASTVVPSSVSGLKADMNDDTMVDGGDIPLFVTLLVNGGGTPVQKYAGDVQTIPNGTIDDADVDPFVACLLNGGCL